MERVPTRFIKSGAAILWILWIVTLSALAQSPGSKLWEFVADDKIRSAPAIAPDGTISCSSAGGILYALTPSGTQKWYAYTLTSGSVDTNGIVYFGSGEHQYAVDAVGIALWRYHSKDNFDFYLENALGADRQIYAVANGWVELEAVAFDGDSSRRRELHSKLYRFSPDGSKQWGLEFTHAITCPPVVGIESTVYVVSNTRVFAFDSVGWQKWALKLRANVIVSPAIGADGTVYIADDENRFYAIAPDGTLKWEFRTGDKNRSSPAIGPDGTIYFGSDDHRFYALAPDGAKRWEFATTQEIRSSPAIAADGTIYFGCGDGRLYAMSPAGMVRWTFATGAKILSSPAIAADGTVYIGSDDRRLYALKGTAGLAITPWPKYRGGARQTGRVFEVVSNGRGKPVPLGIGPLRRLRDGRVEITVTNQLGKRYQFEASADLTRWVSITNLIANTAPLKFFDDAASAGPARFYRIRALEP